MKIFKINGEEKISYLVGGVELHEQKIVSTESNWVKVSEKNTYRIINGDMIRDIKIMPEKYQKD